MEKKNINTGLVRTCTILLLTVFTIGRKYGQNAEDLIKGLKQQPCACCLNFGNVSEVAKVIDRAKNQLQNEKNQLQQDKQGLIDQKGHLEGQLQETKIQAEAQKRNLREEIQKWENENEKLGNEISNLKNGNKENAGAAQVAKDVNEKLSKYIGDLTKTKELNIVLQNEKQKFFEEKTTLEKKMSENNKILQEKNSELEKTKKEIENLKKDKEKIESDLQTKNDEIETCKKEKNELNAKKTQLENALKTLEDEYKKNYGSIVSKYNDTVNENSKALEKYTEEIKKTNVLLGNWKSKNETLNKVIYEKGQEIKDLNEKIKEKALSIDNLNKEKNELNKKWEELNEKYEILGKQLEEISKEKQRLESDLKTYSDLLIQANKEKNSLEEILKNTKTNVNIEELVKFYNSIFVEKKTKIGLLLDKNVKDLPEKKYTFYIPFKFKGKSKKDIIDIFTKKTGIYSTDKTLDEILQSLFERCAFEKFKEEKIIDVKILKEIYYYTKFQYTSQKLYDEQTKVYRLVKKIKTNPEAKDTDTDNINIPTCFTTTKICNNNCTSFKKLANGTAYNDNCGSVLLNYSEFIELVKIDEYWDSRNDYKKKDKDLFLLKLDFKDPECIALLEPVGKGNYGVVKKGLTIENGEWVTKAIKFTCSNSKFPNSLEKNILKEILAGKVINEIGVGNKIAFVQDYMTINKFIKRYEWNDKEKKIEPLAKETEDGNLTDAVYTTFLNDNLGTLPEERKNVKADFENNVFNRDGNIGKYLYIMFMNIVNGEDLFFSKKKEELDINSLGDMLFDVLNNLYISGVALKDIKPKNIIWDEKNKNFSIIDVQTLGLVDRKLIDSFGTPELWPFFKTLNLNLESDNKKEDDNNKNKKEDGNNKNKLYDVFCYSIDDNFVDIYAACMTMYFAKFSTYTAAGLLTLLLKWLVLDEENKDKKGWKIVPLNKKFEFLKEYDKNYEKYINLVKRKEEKENINKKLNNNFNKVVEEKKKNNINEINNEEGDYSNIRFFFENIDDRNLNNKQKDKLADFLKEVITLGNESDIFYLLEKIKEKIINKNEKKDLLGKGINDIILFYEDCVKKDLGNFNSLYKGNCKYADVIKYVLCYGSCLNYNGENKKMDVNSILRQLHLKQDIEIQDKEFFGNINNVNVLDNLRSGFNQTFIIDLLTILPLEKYNEILEHDVNKGSVDYYFKRKIDSLKEKNNKDEIEKIEKQKKVFYLLRFLEINKLFHIPKDLLKINSLINNNTKNQLEREKGKNKK